jgi:hypothetical protein
MKQNEICMKSYETQKPDDIHIFEDGEKSDCLATSEAIIVFVD